MVGMIVKIRPDMSAEQTFFEALTGLTAALSARETDLVLAVDQGSDPVLAYERMLERGILDGFILNAPVPDDPRVNFLKSRGIPFVMHGQDRAAPGYPTYGIDNAAVSTHSVKLLAQLGHRRIGLINGELHAAYAQDRLKGFVEALTSFGHSADWIRNGARVESQGYTMALDLLSATPRPTALVCASTLIAAGAMRAINDLDLNVPGDVSIMAHDDALPLTRAINFDPALTVTRAPLRDACVPLANMLIDHINGTPTSELQKVIEAELIVRGSTGPARKDT